jgi:hypothetical protein
MASWLTAEQFLQGVDERTVSDFLSDGGQVLARDQVLASTILDELLDRAMGRVAAALLSAYRYTQAELDALTGVDAAHLRDITSDVALALLVRRRPAANESFARICRENSDKVLQDIRDGKDLLHRDDGGVEGATTPDTSLMSAVDWRNVNTLGDQNMRFPARTDRIPLQQIT